MLDALINKIISEVKKEFIKASEKYGAFNSAHEGFAILHEEFDELWDAIKLNPTNNPDRMIKIHKNATQVSAMAIRLIYDYVWNQ